MKRAILFTVLMIVLRCGDDNGTGTDNNPGNIDDPGITTGTASFVVVERAGQWHKDTLTQTVVSSHFTGDTLVITRLIAIEPAAPVEGIPFLMESRKGGRIKIGVQRAGDERVLLFGWGYFSGAGNGSSDSLRWIGIAPEYEIRDGNFDIQKLTARLYRRAASSWQGSPIFSIVVKKDHLQHNTSTCRYLHTDFSHFWTPCCNTAPRQMLSRRHTHRLQSTIFGLLLRGSG